MAFSILATSAVCQQQFLELGKMHLPIVADHTQALALGDVDGDGDLDLVLGNEQQNGLYLNDGSGRFSDASLTRMPVDSDYTQAVALGDVDGDGDLDLLFGNGALSGIGGQNRLYLNDGTGQFADATAACLPAMVENTAGLALGDVDGDGDLDLVCANAPNPGQPGQQDRLHINDGTGTFAGASAARMPTDTDSAAVALADVDGDGDLDLVLGEEGGRTVCSRTCCASSTRPTWYGLDTISSTTSSRATDRRGSSISP